MIEPDRIVIRGAGELASGVAACLHSVGFQVIMTEIESPLAVRRAVCFSEAIYDGWAEVEGIRAWRARSPAEIDAILESGEIVVFVDPQATCIATIRPLAVIDATLAKRNLGTSIVDAPVVLALGPGFVAGRDAHAVIETNRGHNLARILWEGTAEPNTGRPAAVMGHGSERVLRAPTNGVIRWDAAIGKLLHAGQRLGDVGGQPILAPFEGALRGAIRDGIQVSAGLKIGDVDPAGDVSACFTISDKARAIAGSTLQALLVLMRKRATRSQTS